MSTSDLGFTWNIDLSAMPDKANDCRMPAFMVKKMLPEYVWDIVHLEGNPYTVVDVQTLLSGTTVGGYTLFDQQQVLNQRDALNHLLELVTDNSAEVGKELACQLHTKVAAEEALKWGIFRDGQVLISGTDHRPPVAGSLDEIYNQGLSVISKISHPFERALVYFFWGSMNQFFFDGNKRTSRVMMNFILLREGYYYLTVPGAAKDEFDQMMVDFYDSKDASVGMEFMLGCYQDWN